MPQYFAFLPVLVATGWLLSSKAKIIEHSSRGPKVNICIVIFFSAISFFVGLQISHLTALFRSPDDIQTLRQKNKNGGKQHTKYMTWAPDEVEQAERRKIRGSTHQTLNHLNKDTPTQLKELYNYNQNGFCHHWDQSVANNRSLQPFDMWFTHHPTWVVTNETNEQFCVEPGNIHDHPHIRRVMQFYANQFHSSCDRVHVRIMWGSGWGADFLNIQSGLVYALDNHIPAIIQDSGIPWNYAANKNDSSALTCEEGDTTCYFLPYHDCKTSAAKYWDERNKTGKAELVVDGCLPPEARIDQELGRTAYMFMTRKMLWFRRAVYDFKQTFKVSKNITANSDCTVVHVRRSDAEMDTQGRKYLPVADYVKRMNTTKLSNPNHHIFLLTDDSNAIDEAHEFFPNLNWKYLDRPRHKGSSGGWENHTPSRNPALEVIILVATFELVQECSAIVWGAGNFAEYLVNHMLLAHPDGNVESYRVDIG